MEKPTKSSITEDKRLQYVETRKQIIQKQREEYNYAKQNNLLSERNMFFFLTILEELNLNVAKFSKLSGVSQQLINWWILSDDAKYQTIVATFAKIGYKLEAEFEKPILEPKIIEDDNCIVSISPDIISSMNEKGGKDVTLKTAIDKNKDSAFIARMIYSLNLNLTQFCKKYKMDKRLLQQQITKCRIKISLINKLSENTGLKVIWNLTKASNNQS